jgi:hypothetical protein
LSKTAFVGHVVPVMGQQYGLCSPSCGLVAFSRS